MADDNAPNVHPSSLSEDAAHRLLARAIELDHSRSQETSVDDLREIAKEAGISAEAFDQALRELPVHAPAAPSWWHRDPWLAVSGLWSSMLGGGASMKDSVVSSDSDTGLASTIWRAVISNAVALALIWVLIFFITRITRPMGWQGIDAGLLLGFVLGVGIARRLRVRIVEIGFAGMAAFEVAELAMHLIFGIRSVQGGPTHFAVMIAGMLGVAVGMWTGRRSGTVKTRAAQAPIIVPEAIGTEAVLERRDMLLRTFRLGIAPGR